MQTAAELTASPTDMLADQRGPRRRLAWRQPLKRFLRLLIVLVLVTFLSFVLIDLLPGDAAVVVAGQNATPAQVAQVRQELGLNHPLLLRYVEWLGNAAHGNLGHSFQTGQSVAQALSQRIPVSLELAVLAEIVAILVAIPLGMYSAYRQGSIIDRLSMTLGFGASAMPQFVLGLLLILLFAGGVASVLPATGFVPFGQSPLQNFRDIAMPCLTLAVGEAAVYRQLIRSDMVSTLQEDYILLAKSKGLSNMHILLRHAFRPSSFSFVTLAGVNIGRLIGGTVIVETMFALPGVGQLIVESVNNRDYPMLQGALLFVSTVYVVINMFVDVLYTVLDPRVRRDA